MQSPSGVSHKHFLRDEGTLANLIITKVTDGGWRVKL